MTRYKYPRTPHLPWSESITDDDKVIKNLKIFYNNRVIVSIKMDGENCIDGKTEILVDYNKCVSIEELYKTPELYSKILSFNEDTQYIENDFIETVIESEDEDIWYEIELENGKKINITENHRVYLPELNCYRKVSELSVGDKLLQSN